jgi:hypothetical protein
MKRLAGMSKSRVKGIGQGLVFIGFWIAIKSGVDVNAVSQWQSLALALILAGLAMILFSKEE